MVHWRKTHMKPTVFTNNLVNHLESCWNHLIPTLYHDHFCSSLLVTYKEVLAGISFSLHAHSLLTFLFSVMSFLSRLSFYLDTKRALFSWPWTHRALAPVTRPATSSFRTQTQREAAFHLKAARGRAAPLVPRWAVVGQAGGGTERIFNGAREEGGHCGQPKQRERGEGTEENWIA